MNYLRATDRVKPSRVNGSLHFSGINCEIRASELRARADLAKEFLAFACFIVWIDVDGQPSVVQVQHFAGVGEEFWPAREIADTDYPVALPPFQRKIKNEGAVGVRNDNPTRFRVQPRLDGEAMALDRFDRSAKLGGDHAPGARG